MAVMFKVWKFENKSSQPAHAALFLNGTLRDSTTVGPASTSSRTVNAVDVRHVQVTATGITNAADYCTAPAGKYIESARATYSDLGALSVTCDVAELSRKERKA